MQHKQSKAIMRKLTKAQQQLVKTQANTNVKHSAFITLLQVRAQNAANAARYTAAQHATVAALARAVQATYFKQRVYTNLRAKFVSIKVNNAQVCSNLMLLAKQYNASVVQTQNAIVLRLFA